MMLIKSKSHTHTSFAILLLATSVLSPFLLGKVDGAQQLLRKTRLNLDSSTNKNDGTNRTLIQNFSTTCIGPTLKVGETLVDGQSICDNTVFESGEMVYFGVIGWNVYVWSETYGPVIVTERDDPRIATVMMQRDGDLKYYYEEDGMQKPLRTFARARAKPGRTARELSFEGPLPNLMKIVDNEGDIIRRTHEKKSSLSPHKTWMVAGKEAYPELEDRCVTALQAGDRLSWKEFVCEFDSEGWPRYKFGLDDTGYLGLWWHERWFERSSMRWRPRGEQYGKYTPPADYLHLQKSDGHLTYYLDTEAGKTVLWGSRCFDATVEKLIINNGDLYIFNEAGAVVWTLPGSKIVVGDPYSSWEADSIDSICHPGGDCT